MRGARQLSSRWQGWLSHRRLPWVAVLVSVVLSLPGLGLGWQLDDHFQRLAMLDEALGLEPLQYFSVLRGDVEANRVWTEWGVLPWWTPPEFRLAFLRYLSVLTSWVDYRLWPDSAPLMHLHSLAWLAALVLVAATLYRRLVTPPWAAGLAMLLLAVEDHHGVSAVWLANRNALLCGTFGIAALLCHHRARSGGGRWAGAASAALLAAALASGEAAVATAGYLLSYALFVDRGSPRDRAVALLPHAVVVAGWATLYRWLGYGSYGSGIYHDPGASPGAFLASWLERAPFLLLGQWTPVPADVGSLLDGAAVRLAGWAALLVLAVLAAALGAVLWRRRTARFWGLGMLLATVPAAATAPTNRVLLFIGLGGTALVAELAAEVAARARAAASPGSPAGAPRAARWALGLLVVFHLVLAPPTRLLAAASIRSLGEPMLAAIRSLPAEPGLAQQTLVAVNPPDYLVFLSHLPTVLALERRPLPRRIVGLAAGPTAVTLSRVSASGVRVELERGPYEGALGRLFRSRDLPFLAGDRVRLPDVTVEIEAVDGAGVPLRVLYRFAGSAEDPALRWVRWEDGEFVPFSPPPVGESLRLAAPRGPMEVLRPLSER